MKTSENGYEAFVEKTLKPFINELGDMSQNYIFSEYGKAHKVDFKVDNSPVTQIDKNTEYMLREHILKNFPQHGIIGEEYGNHNENAEFVWVLDPIDGTKSFISSVPLFGTLIGLTYNKKPILGLINQPILKERIVGDNKTCLYNGTQVRVSDKTSPEGMTLLTSDSRYAFNANPNWKKLEDVSAISRTWGDCYGYMLLTRGIAHCMLDANLEVWDLVALLPALYGAGAVVSDYKGNDNIGPDGLMATCSKQLHSKIIDILNS